MSYACVSNSIDNSIDWVIDFILNKKTEIVKLVSKKCTSFLNGRSKITKDEIIQGAYMFLSNNPTTDQNNALNELKKASLKDLGLTANSQEILYDVGMIEEQNEIFCETNNPELILLRKEDELYNDSEESKFYGTLSSISDGNKNTEDEYIEFNGVSVSCNKIRNIFNKMTKTQRLLWSAYLEYFNTAKHDENTDKKITQEKIAEFISKKIGRRVSRQTIFSWNGTLNRGLKQAGLITEPVTYREKLMAAIIAKRIPMPDISKFIQKYPIYRPIIKGIREIKRVASSVCSLLADRPHTQISKNNGPVAIIVSNDVKSNRQKFNKQSVLFLQLQKLKNQLIGYYSDNNANNNLLSAINNKTVSQNSATKLAPQCNNNHNKLSLKQKFCQNIIQNAKRFIKAIIFKQHAATEFQNIFLDGYA